MKVAIIGSRNLTITHQQIIETLTTSLVMQGNTIITSGGSSGTNAAAIRGALKANPEKLKIILPQTIGQQDMMRMHYYTSEYGDFARQFVTKFLSAEQVKEIAERPSMMPFPPSLPTADKSNEEIMNIDEPKQIIPQEIQL